jgi:CRP-like cAMP-binding protein
LKEVSGDRQKSGPACLTNYLTQSEREYLELEKVTRTYKKGQYIYREGFSASDFVIIQKGVVKVSRQKISGEECLLDFHNPNSLIGLESISDNDRYKSSAIAFTDVSIWIIKRHVILKLFKENSEVCRYLSQSYVSTISSLLDRIQDLSSGHAHIRLGGALLLLHNHLPEFRDKGLLIKREELAEISGISRETVSRILSTFKQKKLINIINRRIHILDEKKIIKLIQEN